MRTVTVYILYIRMYVGRYGERVRGEREREGRRTETESGRVEYNVYCLFCDEPLAVSLRQLVSDEI